MKDTKEPATGEQRNAPLVAEASQSDSDFTKTADKRKSSNNTGKRGAGWLWFLLFLAALCAIAAGVWRWLPQVREPLIQQLQALPFVSGKPSASAGSEAITRTPAAQPQPDTTPTRIPEARAVPVLPSSVDISAALRQQLQQQNQTIRQLQQQLTALQRRVTTQGNRLSELGNASRADWQLAEADYLLRLASQRLLFEQDQRSALGLMEEVDSILRQLNLPDLYVVREQLARDLSALKLAENVDREGLYLRLRALEEQMLRLNIQPEFNLVAGDTAAAPISTGEQGSPLRRSWTEFLSFLKSSIRVRDGEIDPVLLSPQSEARFRQSLRLNMEQAELAVLRANGAIYKDALNHARQLLLDYGVDNRQRQVILQELQALSDKAVVSELPNINTSQKLLHNYIERLHSVAPAQPASPSERAPQPSPAPGAGSPSDTDIPTGGAQ